MILRRDRVLKSPLTLVYENGTLRLETFTTAFDGGKKMKRYIGVTGFTETHQVDRALALFPQGGSRDLMVGVLASYKSLRRIHMSPRWGQQTPQLDQVRGGLFQNRQNVVNLIHYASHKECEDEFGSDLFNISGVLGHVCDGFQLNMAWPDVDILEKYYGRAGNIWRIVLQINQAAISQAGNSPRGIVEKLRPYTEIPIDDVLIDLSGGTGKPLEPELVRPFLGAIADSGLEIGLGVAGGLGPNSLHLIEPLLSEFPDLNWDAQGQLRNGANELDLNRVVPYLQKSLQLVAR